MPDLRVGGVSVRLERWLACAIVLLVVPGATAAARPRGPGVIRGTVVDGSSGAPVAGVPVDLVSSLPGGGEPFSLSDSTDRKGRYVFSDLPTGSDRVYAVSVEHRGGLFTGQSIDELGVSKARTVVDTRLRVWDTISDPDAVLVQRHNVFIDQAEAGLGVIESLTIVNTSDAAYIGRARSLGREVAKATFGFALPARARDGRMLPESDFFGTPITGTDSGFGLRVAIPPGEWRVMFAYRLPGTAGTYDLTRPALYPTLNTAVHATGDLAVDSNRLNDAGDVTIGDIGYGRWVSTGVIEAGEPIQIGVTAGAGFSPWLTGGLVVATLLAGALFALTYMRNRRPAGARPAPTARERLVAAVAELDLQHDAGDLGDDEWRARREQLMGKNASGDDGDAGKDNDPRSRRTVPTQ